MFIQTQVALTVSLCARGSLLDANGDVMRSLLSTWGSKEQVHGLLNKK